MQVKSKIGGKIWHFLTHCKNRVGLVERSVGVIRATPKLQAPVYFLPEGDWPFAHIKCGWLKKKIQR